MSSVQEAYKIPVNSENKSFVANPYIPLRLRGDIKSQVVRAAPPQQIHLNPVMTRGRVFDVKYGALPLSGKN
jgi:hypothetical protein